MKIFRYRKPSLSTALGITKLKKQTNKKTGITAAMRPFRAKNNFIRKIKRQAGYYSGPAKALRYASQSHSGTKKRSSAGNNKKRVPKVKVIRVGYGFFGRPNSRGIQKAVQKWANKGYKLKQYAERKRGLFSFGYTALIFVEILRR